MAFATLNGRPVFDGSILLPRVGAWTADVRVDSQTAITGACALAIDGGLTLQGTAHSTGVWLDTAHVRLVAGADGLGKAARPRHYRRTTLRIVLADLLATAGEKLAANSDAGVLGLSFPGWVTRANPVGLMVSALLEDQRLPAGTAWRMLPDGTLWVGVESWPDSGLADVVSYQDLEERPADGQQQIAAEAPTLLPGTLLAGRKVTYVEHRIDGEKVRSLVLWE
jgi:hypothetical protein